ncbi:sensor domain-containing diguanylate cyclase [Oceanidesulfovibrio marinus]|uniref:Diguanylate cyclase n=1 Tax=Oceanidesulfovibrio marinus TaxID=370038 RepID=A0ABX6NA77_9BACT|nr:diguanylate cyclase [Oceanidesulfovibrio marinus]QJT07485.1 diguanylate cyclase [Oceanidesulfovibrio marinus]
MEARKAAYDILDEKITPLVWRRFLAYFIPTAAVLVLLAHWFLTSQFDEAERLTAANERTTVLLERQFFEDEIAALAADVRFLSDYATGCLEMKELAVCPRELRKAFMLFAKEHPTYFQMILLDVSGQELLHVENVNGRNVGMSASGLRSQAASPWYVSALEYSPRVWISSIKFSDGANGLSPGTPMLHASRAILDEDGRTLGVVVIGYDGSMILQMIAQHELASTGWHYLFRSKGPKLRGPTLGKESSGDLSETFPELWSDISRSKSGTRVTKNGLFAYETVCSTADKNVVSRVLPVLDECWVIVNHVPWAAIVPAWLDYAPWVGGAALLLVAAGMWTWARTMVRRHQAEKALRMSEERMRTIVEAAGVFIWETDDKGVITYISDMVREVLGYAPEELIGQTLTMLMPADKVSEYSEFFLHAVARKLSFRHREVDGLTKDGRRIHQALSAVPVEDESGRLIGYRGSTVDVTRRKKAQEELRESERKARAMLEASHDAMIVIDGNGSVQFWNHAAENMFGYLEAEALGMDVHVLVVEEEDRKRADAGTAHFAKTGEGPIVGSIGEFQARRKDGTVFPVEHAVAAFRMHGAWYAVGSVRDKTEQKEAEKELQRLATTDSLTGLANRRHFFDGCRKEIERHKRYGVAVSLLMLDVDLFKKINDTWGHDTGDRVLKEVAAHMLLTLRDVDLCGRIGGEEFAVLLPETDLQGAAEAAERVRASLENICFILEEGARVCVTASLGVAEMGGSEDTLQELIKRADDALYEAKETGRNKVVVKA